MPGLIAEAHEPKIQTAAAVYSIDPVADRRWARCVQHHHAASVFHTPQWLEALRRTYDYEPVALTTAPPGTELTDGLAFCRVRSWITGSRMVSLPFSDHCEPLVEAPEGFATLLAGAERQAGIQSLKYIEIRPQTDAATEGLGLAPSQSFWLHRLDLRPGLPELFQRLHKDCLQRKIRRASREGVVLDEGRSEELLESFYRLLVITRRRQGLPPQPMAWFRNLIACMDDASQIRVASKNGRPLAAIVTLRFGTTMTYKYGASDRRFSHLGAIQLLLWTAIEEAKHDGLTTLDLGRTDLAAPGLLAFKDRLGAARFPLTYWRYPQPGLNRETGSGGSWRRLAGGVLGHMPVPVLTTLGRLTYRHAA